VEATKMMKKREILKEIMESQRTLREELIPKNNRELINYYNGYIAAFQKVVRG